MVKATTGPGPAPHPEQHGRDFKPDELNPQDVSRVYIKYVY